MNAHSRNNNRRPDPKPLYSENSERALIGICLQDQELFWDAFTKVQPQHFAIPRLARIWDAMCRIGEAGKIPKRDWIPLYIKGDQGEETPISMLTAILVNDASEIRSDGEAHLETVLHLANKRALIDSLERAKMEIMDIDVGTPVEHMQDRAIKSVSAAVDSDDGDFHLRSYAQWGKSLETQVFAAFQRGEDGGIGLSPGLSSVEDCTGRLLPGKVYVLAGMSSGGKSALARQIAEAASLSGFEQGQGFGYIASLEMQGEEYAARHVAERLHLPGYLIEQGGLNQAEVEALAAAVHEMKRYPIIIDTKPRMGMEDIRSRMMRTKQKRGGLSFGVVDHLLLVKGGKNDSIMDRVSAATAEAKNLAKEFNMPMIMLAQLDEKRILESPSGWPNSSHLFGGQAIQQNTDVTLFVHRPEIVLAKKEPPQGSKGKENEKSPHEKWVERMDAARGRAYVFNNKRRGGAGNTKRELLFDGPTMTFRDI